MSKDNKEDKTPKDPDKQQNKPNKDKKEKDEGEEINSGEDLTITSPPQTEEIRIRYPNVYPNETVRTTMPDDLTEEKGE